MRNIYVSYNGETSEIDVLMIHEKEIFVFESKNIVVGFLEDWKIRSGHSVYLTSIRLGFIILCCKIELTLKHWRNF